MPDKWTKNEERELIRDISNGKSFKDIAHTHNRSETAVELRIKKIIYENIEKGLTPVKMAKILNLSESKVNQFYYEYKGFNEKKQNGGVSNLIDGETKDIKPTVIPENKADIKQDNKEVKINKLLRENELMKEIIDNIEMKRKINKYVKEGILGEDVKDIIRKYRK